MGGSRHLVIYTVKCSPTGIQCLTPSPQLPSMLWSFYNVFKAGLNPISTNLSDSVNNRDILDLSALFIALVIFSLFIFYLQTSVQITITYIHVLVFYTSKGITLIWCCL